MVPSLSLLSRELSVSVKENPDRKKKEKKKPSSGRILVFYAKCIYGYYQRRSARKIFQYENEKV